MDSPYVLASDCWSSNNEKFHCGERIYTACHVKFYFEGLSFHLLKISLWNLAYCTLHDLPLWKVVWWLYVLYLHLWIIVQTCSIIYQVSNNLYVHFYKSLVLFLLNTFCANKCRAKIKCTPRPQTSENRLDSSSADVTPPFPKWALRSQICIYSLTKHSFFYRTLYSFLCTFLLLSVVFRSFLLVSNFQISSSPCLSVWY